ncbi:transposase [Listeria cornellensis]|uniref:Transposase n=1 Tax=Listeria cornellensis FSL F6-0969 TaxID=1265820 RepID=W7CAG9_9LIST|nr:transposase [Listeria cornellensis]EUJ32766.1 hypothetical protein PCORN_00470 [Listeria cornellensis FSL F6-0969]
MGTTVAYPLQVKQEAIEMRNRNWAALGTEIINAFISPCLSDGLAEGINNRTKS